MITFTVALAALIAGYFIYGKFVSRVFGVDPKRATPAYTKQDGVDYIPMPAWKIFMIQFLNIFKLTIAKSHVRKRKQSPLCGLHRVHHYFSICSFGSCVGT